MDKAPKRKKIQAIATAFVAVALLGCVLGVFATNVDGGSDPATPDKGILEQKAIEGTWIDSDLVTVSVTHYRTYEDTSVLFDLEIINKADFDIVFEVLESDSALLTEAVKADEVVYPNLVFNEVNSLSDLDNTTLKIMVKNASTQEVIEERTVAVSELF